MTIEEIQAQLAKLQAEVDSWMIGEHTLGEKEWPQQGDMVWYINSAQEVTITQFEERHSMNQKMKKAGMYYRTEEACAMEALRRECRASRPKVDWTSNITVHYVERKLVVCDQAIHVPITAIDSGLYSRTESEARERWSRYGKAFEYLISNQE